MKTFKFCLIIVLSVVLTACGGGGGGDGQSGSTVASVNLGADQNVLEGQTFTLTATVFPEGGECYLNSDFRPLY